MHITISVLFLIQALNARALIPAYVYDQATAYENQDPPYPNIDITVWSGPDCRKIGDTSMMTLKMDDNADNLPTYFLTQSYYLSRDLINDERLDWSTCSPPGTCTDAGPMKGYCGKFVQRTSLDSNGNSLLGHTCYSLVPGATVSHLSREEFADSVCTKIEYLVRQSLERQDPPCLYTRRRNKWGVKVTYSAVEQIIESKTFLWMMQPHVWEVLDRGSSLCGFNCPRYSAETIRNQHRRVELYFEIAMRE